MSVTCIRCGLSFEPTTDLRVCARCAAMIAPLAAEQRSSAAPPPPSVPSASMPGLFAAPPPPDQGAPVVVQARTGQMSGGQLVLTLAVVTLLLDVAVIWFLRAVGATVGRTGVGTLSDLVLCGGLIAGARWARSWMIARACLGLVIALGMLVAVGRGAPVLLFALVGVDIAMRLAWLWALTRPDVVERFR